MSKYLPMLFFITLYGRHHTHGANAPLDDLRRLSQMDFDEVIRNFGSSSFANPYEPQAQAVSLNMGLRMAGSSNRDGNRRMPNPLALSALQAGNEDIPMAENAGCLPTDMVVEMILNDPQYVVYPAGTKIKQCAGICGHASLACHPTASREIFRKGLLLEYKYGKLVPSKYHNFTLIEHVSCGCGCLQKPTDCQPYQHYEVKNCKCVCNNEYEMTSCGPHKEWDEKDCQCVCPKSVCRTCGNQQRFDENTCKCVSDQNFRSRQPGRSRHQYSN